MNRKELFFEHQSQITEDPIGLEVSHAKGIYIFDKHGKKYIDLVAGVSACTLGHSNKQILQSINQQLSKYTHVMVYGEYIQDPQINLAKKLAENLPKKLNCSYFVNSGTESIEGAIKLAKRTTKKHEIVYCENSYHGSTHGSLSYMGNEKRKSNYRPLLPGGKMIRFNSMKDLKVITKKTAAVIIELVQSGSGFQVASKEWVKKIRNLCDKFNTILIFDEIQTCFGRIGKLFGFQKYKITPDILCIAKGMGGGMPIGCFISSKKMMKNFQNNPVLGHITTFGGHPVNCAAALKTLEILNKNNIIHQISKKEKLFKKLLSHKEILNIHGIGLMLGVQFKSEEICDLVIKTCRKNGLLAFYFLFEKRSMRISPPLTITEKEIRKSCQIIIKSINQYLESLS